MKRFSLLLCLFALAFSASPSRQGSREEIRGAGRSRQGLSAENLGWLVHSRSG